ncbi:MAG: DNA primase [Bacteroidetes bacterium]|nr:DNA primase [Bacteroidota bacterium]
MITKETIDQIMDIARIEEVIGEFVTLKKRGANYIGLCPFHDEKTPSFSVSASKGIFKCFGCGKGGNAVNFVMDHEHFTYPEALKFLAKKYNIHIEEIIPDAEQQQAIDEKESLFNLSAFAQKYFSDTLNNSEEGKSIGLTYFKERGFTTDTIIKFGLGYCPNKWDDFTKHAQKNGYQKELLLETSLSKLKDGSLYDTFRARVIFPIHNLSGRVLGFGARILTSEKDKAKYLNSAESEIYQKSKVLYGLYFAKSAIVKEDNCYLVEGYTDVISMHQAGIENVVSSSGTSLTIEQIKLLRRYTNNITLLFDSDAAGIKAAFRSTDMILEEGMNVRIVLFPEGEDPDSYAKKYRPAEVREYLDTNLVDFISFKTGLLYKETKDDPIKKAGIIKEIANTISLIPDPITRTLYVQKCSSLVNVDEKILHIEINKQRKQKLKEQFRREDNESNAEAEVEVIMPPEQLKPIYNSEYQEKEILRVMMQYGLNEISFTFKDEDNKEIEEHIRIIDFMADEIGGDDIKFENESYQALFDIIVASRNNDTFTGENAFLHNDDANIRDLAIELLSSRYSLSDQWKTKHSIYVNKEVDNLKQNILGILYSFKLKKLEKMITDNQEILKSTKDPEGIMHILTKDAKLKRKRIVLAKQLSRIVTK